jgi:uncharacterized protein
MMMSLKTQLSSTAGVIYLLLVCLFFRLLDIFVWKMDERIGEIILSKSIGFLLIFLFLAYTGRELRDIHLYKVNRYLSLKLAISQALLALVLCYSVKYLFLVANNAKPILAYTDDYTIFTMILFVLVGNLMNTLMEEGLFRGLMLQAFHKKMPFFAANLLQAFLFGLWHIPWIVKDYITGKIAFSSMISNSILYCFIAGIMGLMMGYMYHRTKNLWTAIVWHFVWNCTMNLLIIHTLNAKESILQQADVLFWLTFLGYSVLSFWITFHFTKKPAKPFTPEVTPK